MIIPTVTNVPFLAAELVRLHYEFCRLDDLDAQTSNAQAQPHIIRKIDTALGTDRWTFDIDTATVTLDGTTY